MSFQLNQPRFVALCASISLLIHLGLLALAWNFKDLKLKSETPISAIELRLVDSKQLKTMDTLQEESQETPEDAKFASDRNLKTEIQTSPLSGATNIATGRLGKLGSSKEKSNAEQKPLKKKVESFSLSKEELVAMNDPFTGSMARENSNLISPGFLKRLQYGEELKLNALGLDYGQYIIRMRDRLAQRWNPRRTIKPEMYDYNVIEVVLGIVLNDNGKLVDMKVIKTSFFPEYDEEAKETFRASEPFPNPPDSLIQEDGKVYMPWAFTFHFHGFGTGEVY